MSFKIRKMTVSMTDFFDFSIYVDLPVDDIESWYIDRFQKLLALAQMIPITTTIDLQSNP